MAWVPDGEGKPPQVIAGLTPWLCSYDKDGHRCGITLYGDSAEQVLNNNCAELPGLTVDGVLSLEVPAKWIDDDDRA